MTTQEILQGVHDWTLQKVVYDISAAHLDGQGNPTPYADLAAALDSNNGGGIPEYLQKGGMSVKFIKGSAQSSDNKYIQYRYMSSSTAVADFTNTAKWQGVDDEPTAGSENLVKSGGVSIFVKNEIKNVVGLSKETITFSNGTGVTHTYNISQKTTFVLTIPAGTTVPDPTGSSNGITILVDGVEKVKYTQAQFTALNKPLIYEFDADTSFVLYERLIGTGILETKAGFSREIGEIKLGYEKLSKTVGETIEPISFSNGTGNTHTYNVTEPTIFKLTFPYGVRTNSGTSNALTILVDGQEVVKYTQGEFNRLIKPLEYVFYSNTSLSIYERLIGSGTLGRVASNGLANDVIDLQRELSILDNKFQNTPIFECQFEKGFLETTNKEVPTGSVEFVNAVSEDDVLKSALFEGNPLNYGTSLLSTDFSDISVEFLLEIEELTDCVLFSKMKDDATKRGYAIGIKKIDGKYRLYASMNADLTQNTEVSETITDYKNTLALPESVPNGATLYSDLICQPKRKYHIIVMFSKYSFGVDNSLVSAWGFKQPIIKMYINGMEQPQTPANSSKHLFTRLTDAGFSLSDVDFLVGDNFYGKIQTMKIMPYIIADEYIMQKIMQPQEEYSSNLIVDFDIDTDCDDFGDAISSLALDKEGEINLLGYIVSTPSNGAAAALEAVMNWYGNTKTIASYKGEQGYTRDNSIGNRVAEEFNPTKTRADYPDDLLTYRRLLFDAQDGSVDIVSTGYFISLERLLKSNENGVISSNEDCYLESDVVDNLGISGIELVRKKVRRLICVASTFPTSMSYASEWDIYNGTPESFKYVVQNLPVPIIFSGGDTGTFVKTNVKTITPSDLQTNPVLWAYTNFNNNTPRGCWGTICILLCARGYYKRFVLSHPFITQFDESEILKNMPPLYTFNGNCRFIRFAKGFKDIQPIADEIQNLISARP